MPRFYIHIDNGQGPLIDEIGAVLAGLYQAVHEVIRTASGIAHEELIGGGSQIEITLRLEDALHHCLASMALTASLNRDPGN